MLRTDADHLPASIREELLHVTTILFEAFAETTKGRCSEHYRAGRILALILHGPHAEKDWEHVAPGEAFRLLAIVNYPRLARSERDWRLVRDRLRRAWEFGEIARSVRLSVECLERINHALVEGVPHFATVAERGIALYQMEGLHLKTPRHLPARERAIRGIAEYLRWHKGGSDFLAGAAFYRDQGIRRAYVEVRYGRSYRISPQELAWAFGRVEILQESVVWACADNHAALIADASAPMLPAPTEAATTTTLPQPLQRTTLLRRTWQIARRTAPSRVCWNRLIRVGLFRYSQRFTQWAEHLSFAVIGLSVFLAGAEAALWRARSIYTAQTVRSEPADPSAVLDFDVRADTILGAVGDIANRAGYRIKANEDIWAMRWTGAYRAKATTFDALSDVLYGSGLCPAIRDDTITVRYCDKSRPPRVVSIGYQTMPDGSIRMELPR